VLFFIADARDQEIPVISSQPEETMGSNTTEVAQRQRNVLKYQTGLQTR
jgi:hypothetical protein